MRTVWVHYPPLRHHSEIVFQGAEGTIYFGGRAPAGVDDMVWTGASLQHVESVEPTHRLLVLEPPVVDPRSHDDEWLKQFPRVYSFGKSELQNVRHYRMGIPPLWPQLGALNLRPWSERKNAIVCVTGNKYPFRKETLERYARAAEQAQLGFDVYGRPGFEGESWYRGEVQGHAESKRLLLSQYRYALCLENTFDHDLYLTEKLPDALVSGCRCFYEGGPVQETYPEIPWEWVRFGPDALDPIGVGTYLSTLTERMHKVRKGLTLNPLWRMILKET